MNSFNVLAMLSAGSAMSEPRRPNPAVLHLSGVAGIGKTRWLAALAKANPGVIQISTPKHIGQQFDFTTTGFDEHAAIAIDEVQQWDRSTLIDGIAALEARAIVTHKTLILITQGYGDLASLSLRFSTSPHRIRLESNPLAT